MNYTLHQLKVFLAIVDFKSITKASKHLNLSQPAVSIQFRNFQDQFSLPLIDVIGKKVFITDFGHEIAKAARNIIFEVEEINYKIQQFNGLISGKIRISVVSTGKYVIPYFISDFFMNNMGIDLFLDSLSKIQVVESLRENHTDFALMTILPTNMELEQIELMPNHLFLVCSIGIWNAYDQNLKTILQNRPFLLREQGSATRFLSDKFLEKNKVKPNKKIELTSNEALKHAILAGMGISILPLVGMKNEIMDGSLKIIPKEELPIVTTWRLVWLKDKSLSPASRAFLTYLEKEKWIVQDRHFNWIKNYTN
jgi:DNA-binding transcriptional LysR family regulator